MRFYTSTSCKGPLHSTFVCWCMSGRVSACACPQQSILDSSKLMAHRCLGNPDSVTRADICMHAAERSSPQQRQASTEVASTSSSALSTQAEPKEAEVVQDEEHREERYNPVMW